MKTPLVRAPVQNELWWSVLARHSSLFGYESLFELNHCLSSLGSPLFPRQLAKTLANLDCSLTIEELIQRHTLLPFYAAFLPTKQIASAVTAMRDHGNVEFILGLAAMKERVDHLRFCPQCRAASLRKIGAAWWNRLHQIALVLICEEHSCNLVVSSVSSTTTPIFQRAIPLEEAKPAKVLQVPKGNNDDTLWLAQSCRKLLESRSKIPTSRQLVSFYRQALRTRDYIDSFDRIRLTRLVRDFNIKFASLLPLVGRHSIDENHRDNWLARLLRLPRGQQSPIEHILLIRFLEIDVGAALDAASDCFEYCGKPPSTRPKPQYYCRITDEMRLSKKQRWLGILQRTPSEDIRTKHDTLYSWLWRNEHEWLLTQNASRKSHVRGVIQ